MNALRADANYREPLDGPCPQVTFDIGLGQKVEYIDFDTDIYAEHLRTSGLSDTDIANTSVRFCSDINASNVERYYPGTGRIEVDLGSGRSMNKAVIHGTQHRIDDAHGLLNESSGNVQANLYRARKLLAGAAMLAAGGDILAAANDLLEPALVYASAFVAIVLQLGAISTFAFDALQPDERRALRAEKKITEQFVVIERR
ncbi:MAG TPA: hypothetical protein VNX65_00430 [Patescibacteria group bacterium]|jgi:hypothetical protein|nr:hypothetical protein [Patescibacteria group bacterium]